ncbi:MobF family relaxase [Sphingomonas solaris]|uniref:Conjugative relaxase n=1 Tax=Alterirhizorhabdus solaris TaxID=2529389 RepID=A0A558RAM6_9SPHN|nr:MobF family relaxase [Sphingomonas solaris]TVV76421.1 conjugative relaxase [Sphingomonas solaris]
MHSIASVKSASGAGKYFTNDDFVSGDYYTDEHAGDVSMWGGDGAAEAGLSGAVSREAFTKVLEGELPSGEKVDVRDGRRPGFDLTFSAPKSVSVLAYVAGDKRILGPDGAQTLAVQKTMAWVEKNLAAGRTTADGKTTSVRTGNLVYALFQHDTSRALDPQAHIHAIVANMTKMPDGKWQALDAQKIWASNTVIGSIYHAYLREGMEKLGYKVELTGKHGTFEITGVPKTVLEAYSQRREQILAKADELGIVSPKGRDGVTVNTRDPKLNVEDRDGLLTTWLDKAETLGFSGKDIVAAAEKAVQAREATGPLERGYNAVVEAVKSAGAFLSGLMHSPDPLVDKGILRIAQTPAEAGAQLAAASAVRILNQREAAFDVDRVAKQALDLGVRGVTIDQVEARVERLIAQGKLIPGEIRVEGKMVSAVTTPEALATEERILARVEQGKGQAVALVAPADAPDRLQAACPHELNPGQLAAATMIVAGEDRHVVVQGVAGAGKSTMLQAVARVAEAEGKTVLGLAFQNKMVADMKEGAGIEAQTIASFIWHNQAHAAEPDTQGAREKREALQDTIIVVDETSMVSSDDMLKLMTIAEAMGIEKVAMIGDRQQLSSIDAGKAFAMAQAAGAPMARMDENIRQRTDQLRTVAALANVGRAGQALRVLGDKVVENADPATHAAEMWLALSPEERGITAVFASGRTARGTINETIQAGLVEEGTLNGDGMAVTIHESVSKTREELRYADSYKVGQSLRVSGQVPEVGLRRGLYEVTQVLANGKVEIDHNGRKVRFDPQKIDPAIKNDRLELTTKKEITLHEGDRIRWTANDKERGMLNSALATVTEIENGRVTVELADKETITLERNDPMLSRFDLAYSLNMHMAQGITTDKAITVMLSYEKNLSNQRLFNVGVTRVRDDVTMVVDNQDRLERQLDRNPGDKTSALESLGRLDIDGPAERTKGADDALSAAMAVRDGNEPIVVPDLASLALNDLPPMGASETDYSKEESWKELTAVDPMKPDEAGRDKTKEDLRAAERDDSLGIGPLDMDDLRGLPPMPGEPGRIPGLPEKNLSLDL